MIQNNYIGCNIQIINMFDVILTNLIKVINMLEVLHHLRFQRVMTEEIPHIAQCATIPYSITTIKSIHRVLKAQ